MDELDVVVVAVHGDRKAALRAVRKLVDWPLAQLDARMRSLPLVIATGLLPDDAVAFVGRAASDVLTLAIQNPDGSAWSDPTGHLHVIRRPHIAERVEASRGARGVRFAVDAVTPAAAPPKTVSERARWSGLIEGELLHVPAERALVDAPAHVNPLLSAVQVAFDGHHPLRLTPDAVWLTIAAGFAKHVDRNAEALRARFVRHEGRKTVPVHWNGSFEGVVEALAERVEADVGPGLRRLMTCDFSTSTPLDRCVSEVMFLSTFRRYFDYLLVGICGIPEIELAGTPEDWRALRARLDVLAEYELGFWIDALRPLADEWVRTAEGTPDVAFWRAIYKPARAYGPERTTGWITQLYPYVESGARNPALDPDGPRNGFAYRGLTLDALPSGRVTATVRTDGSSGRRSFELVAGLAGVVVDHAGFLEPVSGWCVVDRPFARVLERIAEEHEAVAPHEGSPLAKDDIRQHYERPAELFELYDTIDSASLFGGRWRLRPERELEPIGILHREGEIELWTLVAHVFADLEGGRRAAYLPVIYRCAPDWHSRTDWWIVLVGPGEDLHLDTPVIAKGIDTFLLRVLDEGAAPFVDHPDFVADGKVRDKEELARLR